MSKLKMEYLALEFVRKLNYNYSYDYDDLIEDLKQDMEEFGIGPDDTIFIVRDLDSEEIYYPIIDYYFNDDHILEEDKFSLESMLVKDVLNELIYLNQIIKNDNMFDKEKN